MSGKIDSLKEKFRLALTSTAKVISDDFELINKSSEKDKKKELSPIEIDNLTKPSDFIKLRAETDSSALKKKFSDESVYKKNLPSNTSSRSLYNIAEKIRYEALGGKMLKGIEKNFQQNYSHIISTKRKYQLKTKEDVPVTEAFELYMLKNFHQIKLNPLTTKMLNFWEKDFEQVVEKHIDFLKENLESQNKYSSKFSEILQEMDIFQNSLLLPPFQFLVVNPRISTLTEHLSKVLDKISAQIAAIVIGLPLIDPELSIKRVTTVSLKSKSFSFLNENELYGSIIILGSFELSSRPSSKSKSHALFCFASNCLCNLFASLVMTS